MAVRITANGRSITGAQASARVQASGDEAQRVRARFQASGDHPGGGPGQRVLVTRTDIGTRNTRLTASEARARGAKNPRSDAQFTANPDAMAYITATRRDALDSESEGTSGDTSTHTAARLDEHHAFKLRRRIASLQLYPATNERGN